MTIDGILNVNKPSGQTSFKVVSLVRKLSGQRQVGHTGTLDPLATGVLPICLGQGTRVAEFLMQTTKTYLAQIELGSATDTYDATGEVTQKGDTSLVDIGKVENVLAFFRGPIQQRPPMYSAVRHQGKHLYELARAGLEVERKVRRAEIFSLELVDCQLPRITIKVECSKGTYIRSLAHDLGQTLGCGAHLRNLVRLRCGPFSIEDALSLLELEEAFHKGYWQNLLFPIDVVLLHWRAAIVDKEDEQAIRNGRPLSLKLKDGGKGQMSDSLKTSSLGGETAPTTPQDRCRAYTIEGHLLAVLHYHSEKEVWQPDKVFSRYNAQKALTSALETDIVQPRKEVK